MNSTVRPANLLDIESISRIHRESLPNDLLPRLGDQFLRKTFYPLVLGDSESFILVSEDSQAIRGFIVFTTNSEHLTRTIGSHWKPILLRLCINIFFDITSVFLLLALFFRKTSRLDSDVTSYPELYVLGVDPTSKGLGIGKSLVSEGLKALSKQTKLDCIVKTDSATALQFYNKIGFKEIGSEMRFNRKLHILIYKNRNN